MIVNKHCRNEQKNDKISRADATEDANLMTQFKNRLQRKRVQLFNVQMNGTIDQREKFTNDTKHHFGTSLRKGSGDDTITVSNQLPTELSQNETARSKAIAGAGQSCDDIDQQNLLMLANFGFGRNVTLSLQPRNGSKLALVGCCKPGTSSQSGIDRRGVKPAMGVAAERLSCRNKYSFVETSNSAVCQPLFGRGG